MNKEAIYTERGAVAPLQKGIGVWVRGIGNSMTPILKSGEVVFVLPVAYDTILKKNDIVLTRVNGNIYLHKITGIKGQSLYQISNNHGHVNGWTTRKNIYGILCRDCYAP